jgi:hypothetical protein
VRTIDFKRHNEEVQSVWDAHRRRDPIRVPMILGTNPRFTMLIPEANPQKIFFEKYMADPQANLERQLEHQFWVRHNIPQDAEMGLPADGWHVHVDFQNTYEAGWFGAEVHFLDDQVPDTRPILDKDENRNLLFEKGQPDPFMGGLMRRNWEFYDHFKRKQQEGWSHKGLPIKAVMPSALGTDGPLTVACNLRGATEFMTDMVADPEYALQLLDFITIGTINRLRAYRQRLSLPLKIKNWGFADDSVQMISRQMYREMILPFHRRLVEELAEGGDLFVHLCGDSTRHFTTLRDELGVKTFDTGFPVNFGELRKDLGPDVQIQGGPDIAFLLRATPTEVGAKVREVLASGVTDGGRFVLREGNNLPPHVTQDNMWAMYDAAKEYGRYKN